MFAYEFSILKLPLYTYLFIILITTYLITDTMKEVNTIVCFSFVRVTKNVLTREEEGDIVTKG